MPLPVTNGLTLHLDAELGWTGTQWQDQSGLGHDFNVMVADPDADYWFPPQQQAGVVNGHSAIYFTKGRAPAGSPWFEVRAATALQSLHAFDTFFDDLMLMNLYIVANLERIEDQANPGQGTSTADLLISGGYDFALSLVNSPAQTNLGDDKSFFTQFPMSDFGSPLIPNVDDVDNQILSTGLWYLYKARQSHAALSDAATCVLNGSTDSAVESRYTLADNVYQNGRLNLGGNVQFSPGIGYEAGNAQAGWWGWIAEVAFYNRALSASEDCQMERYLMAKYGLTPCCASGFLNVTIVG